MMSRTRTKATTLVLLSLGLLAFGAVRASAGPWGVGDDGRTLRKLFSFNRYQVARPVPYDRYGRPGVFLRGYAGYQYPPIASDTLEPTLLRGRDPSRLPHRRGR